MDLEEFKKLWVVRGGVALTDTQWKYVEQISEMADGMESAVLKGAAGTGKTTIMVASVVYLSINGKQVQVSAPTHKAVKVLAEKINPIAGKMGICYPEPRTIHSVLGLKPKQTIPGEPEGFSRIKGMKPCLQGMDLLIVDECSMVGEELYKYIISDSSENWVPVLFTGDSHQLRPVNEYKQSLTFCLDNVMTLKEVLRHDGAILDLATQIRMTTNGKLPPVEDRKGDSSLIRTYPDMENLRETWLKRVEKDPDSVVMLCWTNDERRMSNLMARTRIHGENCPAFMKGDKLLTLKAYQNGDKVLIPNNCEITVDKAEFIENHIPYPGSPYNYDCWSLTLDNGVKIHVLCEEDRAKYTKHLSEVSKKIKEREKAAKYKLDAARGSYSERDHVKNLSMVRSLWPREFFALKEAFAEVDFSYSTTIHKSQGSTYNTVFISNDYLKSPSEKKQLMYVAVTRAANEVHHILTA